MEKSYFKNIESDPLLFQNIEDEHGRHQMESVIVYKDISDNCLKNCLDQLKN